MPILNQISRLVKDPSPNYVFELSEAGIAFAQRPGDAGFAPFDPGTLVVSPVEDNIHKADAATAASSNTLRPSTMPASAAAPR